MEKAYKLVISEKPSVGKSIAAVLGANERKDGYFMGSGYIVSWCFGHLAELAEAAAYDEKYAKWRYNDLPILPESWQYSVARDKAKQLALLNTLMHREDVSEVVNEKAFLDKPADSFAIYQLRNNDDTVQLHYMNSEYLEKKGLSIQKENYAAVYAGDLDRRGDTQDKLNELYETFNIRRPEDFRGHSLSVSDIVALKQNGVVSCHYVDSWGFKELPGFLKPENYLKNAEMAMEDDYGMIDGIINNGPRKTVAELEEQSKTGTPISLLELAQAVQREDAEKRRAQQPVRREKSGEKPSILAKLKTPSVADTKSVKSAPKRSAEREL